jgi:mediator of RNA polymerase II transcription subunit 7
VNFHHLINEYRPHQARESLIQMMQAQLDRTRAETNAIRDVKEKVEQMLEGLGSLNMDESSADKRPAETKPLDEDYDMEMDAVLTEEFS